MLDDVFVDELDLNWSSKSGNIWGGLLSEMAWYWSGCKDHTLFHCFKSECEVSNLDSKSVPKQMRRHARNCNHRLVSICRSTFIKELGLWQKLRHPNIVQFLGVLTHSDRLIFLTEYLRNVSLFCVWWLKRISTLLLLDSPFAHVCAREVCTTYWERREDLIHRPLLLML